MGLKGVGGGVKGTAMEDLSDVISDLMFETIDKERRKDACE